MPKRKLGTATMGRRDSADAAANLRKSLASQPKAELVNVLLELAEADSKILRQLTTRFDVAAAPKELIAATRQAIADATDFDEREINYNFDYDYAAYETVKRNFAKLIALGDVRTAMELALDLMKHASHQVEMSDEGLMTDDIEDCLTVIIQALNKSDLPPKEIVAWCSAMIAKDSVGFIADGELKALRERFHAAT